MTDWRKLQRALKYARRNPGKNVLLSNLAVETCQSLFHAHRTLRAALGETPKHFTLRLRIDRAAAFLISSQATILDIALACGFESHEAFCRAFRRRFRVSPSAYRRSVRMGPYARVHADLVDEIGACVGLYHIDLKERCSRKFMEYSVFKKELTTHPVLVVHRRVRRTIIQQSRSYTRPRSSNPSFARPENQRIAAVRHPIGRELWST